jgi:hypothetical protein
VLAACGILIAHLALIYSSLAHKVSEAKGKMKIKKCSDAKHQLTPPLESQDKQTFRRFFVCDFCQNIHSGKVFEDMCKPISIHFHHNPGGGNSQDWVKTSNSLVTILLSRD